MTRLDASSACRATITRVSWTQTHEWVEIDPRNDGIPNQRRSRRRGSPWPSPRPDKPGSLRRIRRLCSSSQLSEWSRGCIAYLQFSSALCRSFRELMRTADSSIYLITVREHSLNGLCNTKRIPSYCRSTRAIRERKDSMVSDVLERSVQVRTWKLWLPRSYWICFKS